MVMLNSFILSFLLYFFVTDLSAQHDTQTQPLFTIILYYIILLHYIILYCIIIMFDALLGLQAF